MTCEGWYWGLTEKGKNLVEDMRSRGIPHAGILEHHDTEEDEGPPMQDPVRKRKPFSVVDEDGLTQERGTTFSDLEENDAFLDEEDRLCIKCGPFDVLCLDAVLRVEKSAQDHPVRPVALTISFRRL